MKKIFLILTITIMSCAPNNRGLGWCKTTTTTVVTTIYEDFKGVKDTVKTEETKSKEINNLKK